MKLHAPFIITARLCPGLVVGDATISLLDIEDAGYRDRAKFVFDFKDGTEFIETGLESGAGGFRSSVEPFECMLGFLSACAESLEYTQRTKREGENNTLFPPHIGAWAVDNKHEIECLSCDLQVDDSGAVNHNLIED